MNDLKVLDQRYETIAWGAIFILLSILMLVPGDQNNTFVLGVGVILLGLNLARSASRIAVNWFSAALGAIALVLGGLSLLWPLIGNDTLFEVDIIPIIVLAFGLYLLLPGHKKEIPG